MSGVAAALRRWSVRGLLAALAPLWIAGCASVPPGAGNNPADPLEKFNRQVFAFNDAVDTNVLQPVARGYVAVVPRPVRSCVTNVFSNIADLPIALNNLLQGKPFEAVSDLCRFAINTTIGLAGCFDVASRAGLEKHNEDFGQTLGRWGMPSGPYLVLPFLGPSSARDGIGQIADGYTDLLYELNPVRHRNVALGTRLIDTRANLLDATRVFDGAALDRYQFLRDGYLQRRRNLVYDGNPPRMKEEDLDDAPAGAAGSPPAAPPAAPPSTAPATAPAPPATSAPGAAPEPAPEPKKVPHQPQGGVTR
jgi:phospholipid-binding lipoprotein MlaA